MFSLIWHCKPVGGKASHQSIQSGLFFFSFFSPLLATDQKTLIRKRLRIDSLLAPATRPVAGSCSILFRP